MGLTFDKQFKISLLTGVIFYLFSMKFLYKYTNNYFLNESNDCPNLTSKLIHTFFVFLINFLLMRPELNLNKENRSKLKYSFYGALIFFLLSSKEMYNLTRIEDNISCPENSSVFIHSIIYILVILALMQ